VRVEASGVLLAGDLAVPGGARGKVLFASGSGSGRHSPRNRQVAAGLHDAGYGTLLVDLLTEAEERIDARRARCGSTSRCSPLGSPTRPTGFAGRRRGDLPLAAFGASTGAAAALILAADRPDQIAAVISRGGRPDLAGDALGRVRARRR
jgi:hypothetical protein